MRSPSLGSHPRLGRGGSGPGDGRGTVDIKSIQSNRWDGGVSAR
jgi:hypothetical protein